MKRLLTILLTLCLIMSAVPAAGALAETTQPDTAAISEPDISKHEVTLSRTTYSYDGSAKKPLVTIEGLEKGTDFTVKFVNNTEVGKAQAVVTGKGNYTGTVTKEFTINPHKTSLLTPTGVTGYKATIKWRTRSEENIGGYELQYSTSSKFTDSKTIMLSFNDKEKDRETIERLIPNKTYYVRIRTFQKVGYQLYYSSWSDKKSFKTKNTGYFHAMCLGNKSTFKNIGVMYTASISGSTLTVKGSFNSGADEDTMLRKPVMLPYGTRTFNITSDTKYYTRGGNAGTKSSTKAYVLKVMKGNSGLSCILKVKNGDVVSITISA